MIRVVGLVENTSNTNNLKSKHGLSLYIETSKHKILFDLGPNDLFLENAKKLGINLSDIDTVVISHGHTDHAKALRRFLEINNKAKVYIRKSAFDKHYTKVIGIPFYVGLDRSLINHPQIVFTNDIEVIDDELFIYSNVTGRRLFSKANDKLFVKTNDKLSLDSFNHEQYLVITDGDFQTIFSGCSHNGIVNILDKYLSLNQNSNKILKNVVGGFHLFNPITKKYEDKALITNVADELLKYNYQFYTCHCTGPKAYSLMKEKMKDKLEYLSTGKEIELN